MNKDNFIGKEFDNTCHPIKNQSVIEMNITNLDLINGTKSIPRDWEGCVMTPEEFSRSEFKMPIDGNGNCISICTCSLEPM